MYVVIEYSFSHTHIHTRTHHPQVLPMLVVRTFFFKSFTLSIYHRHTHTYTHSSGQYCKDYATFEAGREVVCNPTHNGAVAGASDFCNDTVIKLLNDYIVGYDRLSFIPDGKGIYFFF